MPHALRAACLALVILLSSGCGSVCNLVYGPKVYGGVGVDAHMAVESLGEPTRVPMFFLWVLDLPLSLGMDTLTLPLVLADEGDGHPFSVL